MGGVAAATSLFVSSSNSIQIVMWHCYLHTHRREHQQLRILLDFPLSVRASDNSDIFSNVKRHICHKCTPCLGQVFNIYIHPSYIHTEYMPYMPFELSEDPSNPTYSESLLCTTFLGQVVNIYIHPRCFLATYTPTRTSTMADSARLSTFCPCVRLLRQLRPLTFLQCNV